MLPRRVTPVATRRSPEGPTWTTRCSPTTTAACITQRRARAARAARTSRPGVDAGRRRRGADQVVLLVLDGLGWEQLQERPPPGAHARSRMDGGPITTVAPVHHRHRAHVDRHRPAAGRARRDRLPHGRRPRGAQRPALDAPRRGDARQRIAAAGVPAAARVRRPAPAGGDPAEFAASGLHAGAPRPASASRATACRRTLVGRDRAPRASRASRSSTPTTTASTRSPTSTASASTTTTPSSGAVDRLVADAARAPAAAGRPSWSPPTTARSTSGDDVRASSDARSLAHVGMPVGRGPVPLAARPPRARPTTLLEPPGRATATGLGA